jgi:hypothetical protein
MMKTDFDSGRGKSLKGQFPCAVVEANFELIEDAGAGMSENRKG